PLLFTVLDSNKALTQQFVATCLVELAGRKSALQLFTPSVFEKRADFVRSIVDEGKRSGGIFDKLAAMLVAETNYLDGVTSMPFEVDKAWLYTALARNGAARNQTFVQWCEHGCSKIDKERWLQELNNEGYAAELIVDIRAGEAEFSLGIPYLDALAD